MCSSNAKVMGLNPTRVICLGFGGFFFFFFSESWKNSVLITKEKTNKTLFIPDDKNPYFKWIQLIVWFPSNYSGQTYQGAERVICSCWWKEESELKF